MIRCNLSTLLGARKLKITDVFNATGISRSTLSGLYYEQATRIDFKTVETLCGFLGVGVGELFTLVPESAEDSSK